VLQPDPDHVKSLLELPVPNTGKELQRLVGMFAYHSQWVPCFSEKIKPLIATREFPLRVEALQALKDTDAGLKLQLPLVFD